LETLIDIDKSFFVFLNSLGTESFDSFWLLVTDKKSSIPLYLFLIYYIFKKFSNKEFIKYLIHIIILIILTDQTSGFFKDFFQRMRPCHDQEINSFIRIIKEGCGGLYGFFSAHAANTFAVATFFYFTLNRYSKNFKYLFLWATIVSYSRIYVGVHFPVDIIFGACFGIAIGYLFSFSSNKIHL
jgi:undecaprenyl-diphosphatase|tara:strand:- start:680 stop:1231 length:552 start_codon:yes stop_codon:yes gene_type:complete